MDVGAPAVVAAIADATGLWIPDLPASPERILAGLAGLTVLVIAIPAVREGSIDGVFLASLPLVAFATIAMRAEFIVPDLGEMQVGVRRD